MPINTFRRCGPTILAFTLVSLVACLKGLGQTTFDDYTSHVDNANTLYPFHTSRISIALDRVSIVGDCIYLSNSLGGRTVIRIDLRTGAKSSMEAEKVDRQSGALALFQAKDKARIVGNGADLLLPLPRGIDEKKPFWAICGDSLMYVSMGETPRDAQDMFAVVPRDSFGLHLVRDGSERLIDSKNSIWQVFPWVSRDAFVVFYAPERIEIWYDGEFRPLRGRWKYMTTNASLYPPSSNSQIWSISQPPTNGTIHIIASESLQIQNVALPAPYLSSYAKLTVGEKHIVLLDEKASRVYGIDWKANSQVWSKRLLPFWEPLSNYIVLPYRQGRDMGNAEAGALIARNEGVYAISAEDGELLRFLSYATEESGEPLKNVIMAHHIRDFSASGEYVAVLRFEEVDGGKHQMILHVWNITMQGDLGPA